MPKTEQGKNVSWQNGWDNQIFFDTIVLKSLKPRKLGLVGMRVAKEN